MSEYPVVGTEQVFDGRVIDVRVDTIGMPDGSTAKREIVAHPGAVGIAAIDDDGQLVLVNQYRPALGRRLDELPAGLLDVDGEAPLQAARRELAEEAGLSAGEWAVLADLNTSPGFSDEAIRIYLARSLEPTGEPDGFEAEHEEQSMTVTRIPLDEAVRRVLAGEITNAAAAVGVLAADRARRDGWTGLRPADAPWPDRPDRPEPSGR